MRKLLPSQEITETVELYPEKWNYVSLTALNHQEKYFKNVNQEMNRVT